MDESATIYDLFLCHTGADKAWVRTLAEHVESETFEGHENGRPLRVFFDEWDIEPGENVILRINNGLSRSRYVAVVISPEMQAAPWPTLEWTSTLAGDPVNQRGRLIPLFLRDGTEKDGTRIELLPTFKALSWIDFRLQRDFRKSYQRLIRKIRDMPATRGRRRAPLASLSQSPTPAIAWPDSSAAADRMHEAILGNLLPVESLPGTVWSAPTSARDATDVFKVAKTAPAFELQNQRVFTFCDLSRNDNIFKPILTAGKIEAEPVSSWKANPVRWKWFVSLLNRCVRNHLATLPIRRDEKGRYFFLPKEGATRSWQNGTDPAREVAAKKTNSQSGQEFWVHHAAWLQVQVLGDSLFLLIDPSYVFTSDGQTALRGKVVGPLSIQWSGKERNAAILRHIVFWARTLAKGKAKPTLETGAAPIVLSGIPALARTQRGIEFDHLALGALIDQVQDELGKAAQSMVVVMDDSEIEEDDDDGSPETAQV